MTDTDIAKWKFWSRSTERVGDMSLKYLGAIDIVVFP